MSAIYGYINLDGRPVEPEILQKMKEAMAFCGQDGQFVWSGGNCCLGQMLLWNTPESLNEKYPLTDETGNIIFMASCRLDNREELCRLLDISIARLFSITDGEIMFQAYQKWGKEACDRILGDWSFVAFHKKENKLFVARDHCGITALYYYKGQDYFVFASSFKGLFALKQVPKELNEFRLAQILVAWPGDGEQTCYLNIFNLKPGAYLEIENKEVKKTQFWELKEQPDLILPKEQDYYDMFLDLFTKAVKSRIRSYKNVGIMLSGGLDSTSIAAIAAIELAKENKELYAYTSVPYYKDYKVPKGRNGDEGELAGLMAKKYPNIRHTLVDAREYSVLESIKRGVEILDEPIHSASNLYWLNAIVLCAGNCNVITLLNGQAGNGSLSWPLLNVRNNNIRGFDFYKNLIFKLVKDQKKLSNRRKYYNYPFLKYSDINPEFAQKLKLDVLMKSSKHDPSFSNPVPFKQGQVKFIRNTINNANNLHYINTLPFGIKPSDVSEDKSLLEFSISFPLSIYSKYRYNKILILNCLGAYLPEEILVSKTKGIQAIDIYNRLLNDHNSITKLFQQLQYHSYIHNIIDVNKSTRQAELLRGRIMSQELNPFLFCKALSVILFLITLENTGNKS